MKVLSSKMITKLIMKHGIKGYGVYRFVQDCIEQDHDKQITIDDLMLFSYAIRCDYHTEVKDIVLNYGLFLIDEEKNISNISYLE